VADPFAGATAGTDPLAWAGLGIALVVLASFGLAQPVRLTLFAVILYVLLTNADALAPAWARLARALRTSSPTAPAGGGGGTPPRMK